MIEKKFFGTLFFATFLMFGLFLGNAYGLEQGVSPLVTAEGEEPPQDELDLLTRLDQPVYDLLMTACGEDTEDKRLITQLFCLTGGLETASADPRSLETFLRAADGKEELTVVFTELAALDAGFETAMVDAFDLSDAAAAIGLPRYESLRDIEADMNYQEVNYFASLYVPNIKTADWRLNPVFAVAAEVDMDTEEGEDYIPGWYYDLQGEKVSVAINEENATRLKNPLIIIQNSTTETAAAEGAAAAAKPVEPTAPAAEENIASVMTSYPYFYSACITSRYDRSRKSEYSYELVYLYPSGGIQDGGTRTLIKKVHKNDIGDTFYPNFHVWQVDYLNLNGLFMATFEYDWYASKKTVLINSPLGPQGVGCRMSKSHEWYQRTFFYLSAPCGYTVYSKGHIKINVNPCNSVASFTVNGSSASTVTVSKNSAIVIDASASVTDDNNYFLSVMLSNQWWGSGGPEYMSWTKPGQSPYYFNQYNYDLRTFFNVHNITLQAGQYYRFKLAVSPWNSMTKLLYITN